MRRQGRQFLTGYAAALFGLLLNLVLPVTMAMAAHASDGRFEASLCSTTGVRPVVFQESATYSVSEAGQEHDLCSSCGIHHGPALPIPAATGERTDLQAARGGLWSRSQVDVPSLRTLDPSITLRGPPGAAPA